MASVQPIHPFPARMAPDIVLQHIQGLPRNALIADPMCGSGTVLRVGSETGHRCIGFDLDPLAVLMARVWTTPVDCRAVQAAAEQLVRDARALDEDACALPWVDLCQETQAFIERWFEPTQRADLRKIAHLLAPKAGPISDVLRIALSRTIVTKERGASIARDTSHSRPHSWFINNTYDVFKGFGSAIGKLTSRLQPDLLIASVTVNHGDARDISTVPNGIVDAIITSPPYLNAIDYLRGHRLALVWLGYNIQQLRTLRSESVGTEQASRIEKTPSVSSWIQAATGKEDQLPRREEGMLQRYAEDASQLLREYKRILKPDGRLSMVVGNSKVRGVFVENSLIIELSATAAGFRVIERTVRALPITSRYLPISRGAATSALEMRMKEEVILSLAA